MEALRSKLKAIRSAVAHAFNFAEPGEVLQAAEHDFMQTVTEEMEGFDQRLSQIEQHLATLPKPIAAPVMDDFNSRLSALEQHLAATPEPVAAPAALAPDDALVVGFDDLRKRVADLEIRLPAPDLSAGQEAGAEGAQQPADLDSGITALDARHDAGDARAPETPPVDRAPDAEHAAGSV